MIDCNYGKECPSITVEGQRFVVCGNGTSLTPFVLARFQIVIVVNETDWPKSQHNKTHVAF